MKATGPVMNITVTTTPSIGSYEPVRAFAPPSRAGIGGVLAAACVTEWHAMPVVAATVRKLPRFTV